MKNMLIGILIGFLFIGALAAALVLGARSEFPANMLRNYQIKFAEHAFIPGTKDLLVVIGFEAKDMFSKTKPKSLMGVYKVDDEGARLIYRFSPIVPKEVDYPRPLVIESAKMIWDKQKGLSIFTCWGETGADYWGAHPILFSFRRGRPYPVSFYNLDLSDDPSIKNISWTRRDFVAKNLYDKSQSVKTILTQGSHIAPNGTIELLFWGDDNPRAAEHRIVRLKVNPSWL